jgi:hypothetical protein
MSLTNRVGLLAGLATLTLSGVGFAGSDESYNEALRQIDQLRAELSEMKAEQGDNWLTEQRAQEIRSLVQDVLADADTRASLQSSGMTAGWDKGFFLSSPDGNFRLNVAGQIQVRYLLNYRDNPDVGSGTTRGFEIPRTKLKFFGNIFDRSWTYKIQGNFSQSDFGDVNGDVEVPDGMGGFNTVPFSASVSGSNGRFVLEDAYVQKDFDNGMYVRGGQFKVPLSREELVSSSKQMVIERSTVNRVFGGGRTQGIEGGWQGDWLRFMVMYHDGLNATNTSWDSEAQQNTDWAFAGRAEFKLAGEWGQFDDLVSWNGDPFGVLLGVAANAQRQDDTGDTSFLLTADATVNFGGANVFGSFYYKYVDFGSGSMDTGTANQFGFQVQGGFFIVPEQFQLYARYEYGDADLPGQSDLSQVFAGVNWFFSRHGAVLSTDFGYSFNELTGFWVDNRAGTLIDRANNDGQFVWRTQFQILF